MTLRVLIGCATSCVALNAFLARGHDAWQCDLLPADEPTNRHIQDDIRNVMGMGWDLMIVSNPPCTRLCNSGVRWLDDPRCACPDEATADERAAWPGLSIPARAVIMRRLLAEGAELFSACWNAPVPRVAVENPVMHRHARERLPADVPRPHIVQPWWFGHRETKATGWYLRGLPQLTATDRIEPPPAGSEERRAWNRVHRMPPRPDRARLRSRSYPGMMAAAAMQWAGPADGRATA